MFKWGGPLNIKWDNFFRCPDHAWTLKWIVILFLEFFTMYSKVHILVIWNNFEYGVLMNGSVKGVDN
jgi:hypothetical protein